MLAEMPANENGLGRIPPLLALPQKDDSIVLNLQSWTASKVNEAYRMSPECTGRYLDFYLKKR